jgi:hypothetical protein
VVLVTVHISHVAIDNKFKAVVQHAILLHIREMKNLNFTISLGLCDVDVNGFCWKKKER